MHGNSTPLLKKTKAEEAEKKKSSTLDIWPYVNVVVMAIALCSWFTTLQKTARSFGYPSVRKIMFSKDASVFWLAGEMWRETAFCGYLLFAGFIGILNCIPAVNKAFGKSTSLPHTPSYRSVTLYTALILLNIVWVAFIFAYDLNGVKFIGNAVNYLETICSSWLNLLWALSFLFCTRNTVFQHIYQQPYATIISTHRLYGTLAFWVTVIHVVLCLMRMKITGRVSGFAQLWHVYWNYKGSSYDWRKFGFMEATDLLLKTTPLWGAMMLSAIPWVRRNIWEMFLYLHQVVMVLFFVCFYFHSFYFKNIAKIPIVLYIIDKLVRWISIYTRRCTISVIHAYGDLVHVEITVNPLLSKTVEFSNLVGSVAYINIPAASFWEYHPMSMAYNRGNAIGFFIKVTGKLNSWTHLVATLSDMKGLRAYIEGPYTMEKHTTQENVDTARAILKKYGDNMIAVGGGCGFAGVTAYIVDYIRAMKQIPVEERMGKSLTVILVVTHHNNLEGMMSVLELCQQESYVNLHLHVTYSKNPELKSQYLQGKNANTLTMLNDAEDSISAVYTLGRPKISEIIAETNDKEIFACACGPKSLIDDLGLALKNQKRPFSYHPEIFDM